MDKKYDWHAAACTPEGMPCSVIYAVFSCPDGLRVGTPFKASADEGWGVATSIAVTGPDTKPVPDSLHLLYFAERERKFYQLECHLTSLGIDSIFAAGQTSFFGDVHKNYNELLIGMAPGGKVVVWIGGASKVVELAMFQASELSPDSAKLYIRPEEVEYYLTLDSAASSQGRLNLNEYKSSKYTGIYRQRYLWKPECHVRGKVTRGMLLYFNSERHYEPDFTNWNHYWRHPIPSQYRVFWQGADHTEQALYITFDEAEIISAFETLGGGSADTPLNLKLTINSVSGEAEVFLTDQKSFVSLKKCSFH